MIVFHVTTLKKLEKYKKTGAILPPVRAWENEQLDCPLEFKGF